MARGKFPSPFFPEWVRYETDKALDERTKKTFEGMRHSATPVTWIRARGGRSFEVFIKDRSRSFTYFPEDDSWKVTSKGGKTRESSGIPDFISRAEKLDDWIKRKEKQDARRAEAEADKNAERAWAAQEARDARRAKADEDAERAWATQEVEDREEIW